MLCHQPAGGFVLQPVLVKLTVLWEQKKNQAFLKYCFLMHLAALGISLVILLGGAILGCPVLSLVFGVNLNSYSAVLDVLLIGGGFFSLAVIDQVILTSYVINMLCSGALVLPAFLPLYSPRFS